MSATESIYCDVVCLWLRRAPGVLAWMRERTHGVLVNERLDLGACLGHGCGTAACCGSREEGSKNVEHEMLLRQGELVADAREWK